VSERGGAGGFDHGQAVSQHCVEDIDRLPIAVVSNGEPAPDPFDKGRQHPVFKGVPLRKAPGESRRPGRAAIGQPLLPEGPMRKVSWANADIDFPCAALSSRIGVP